MLFFLAKFIFPRRNEFSPFGQISIMNKCQECGSDRIEYDKETQNRYCKSCGTILEELVFA
jgi:ribosomal protein S27E